MAVQLIQSTDTLETGFRVKSNNNFNELIQSITPGTGVGALPNGKYVFNKNGGGSITLDLTDQYYTKNQVAQLLAQVSSSPYSGAWSAAAPYGPQSITDHNGQLWRSNTTTTTEPGTDGTWTSILIFSVSPVQIPIPAGSETPIIINYNDSTVKIGTADPIDVGADLSLYSGNDDMRFLMPLADSKTKPIGNFGWIYEQDWQDNTFKKLSTVTVVPDTDTGLSGGLTLDSIIIFLPA